MKLVLEEEDLIVLLGKALGYEIEPEDVNVSADPFMVTLNNVKQQPAPTSVTPPPPPRREEYDIDGAPLPETEDVPLSMSELMTHSDLIQKTEQKKQRKRTLGPGESEEPPPLTERELRG